jgi:hypothetical protein
MQWTTEKLAYLAGIIDGEGCFTIEINAPTTYRKGTLYTCRLSIINTDVNLIKWLTENFGGTIHTRKRVNGRKIVHAWRIYANGLDSFLPHCLPYMVCKRNQAEVILRFRSSFDPESGRGIKNTDEICQFRLKCLEELKHFNTLGFN